jgi:ABC-type uncharacterized transport system substrate-binding protein
MRRLLLLLFSLTLALPAHAAELFLIGDEDGPAIRAFTQALAQRRPQDRTHFLSLAELPPATAIAADARLIVLGPHALEWRLRQQMATPTLALRISRVQAHSLLQQRQPANLTFLWSDPPPGRQLRLAKLLQPQIRRIGVLYSQDSGFLLDELSREATSLGLEIVPQNWDDPNDSRPLFRVLRDSDMLLGIDDSKLYNSLTIKTLLLSSYSRNRGLIGPGVGFVRAGSLASSYSDQDDWLAVLSVLLDQPVSRWPRALYPSKFKVQGNHQVARALGIQLEDDAELARRLAKGEPEP